MPPSMATDWNEWSRSTPQNPTDVIAYAELGGTVGVPSFSTNFASAAGTWSASPFSINGTPTVSANGSDNLQNVADAKQWNFDHLTRNSSSSLALPLQKSIFVRPGTDWLMAIPLGLGGSTYTELQLSFLDNAGTSGDAQGTIPVITFTGSFTGSVTLNVTLKVPGNYRVGLWAKSGSTYSMFDMQWIAPSDEPPTTMSGAFGAADLGLSSFLTSKIVPVKCGTKSGPADPFPDPGSGAFCTFSTTRCMPRTSGETGKMGDCYCCNLGW